ncbi:MAG: hypothetical protein AAF587_44000 [Bacteroidota bacterium]
MTKKQPVTNLIEAAFVRPKMYTVNGTYGEVVAFLKGYYSGIAKIQPEMRETIWITFCTWLSKKMNVSIADEFNVLQESYQDKSLEALIQLYYEFKSLNSSSKG